MIFIKTNYYIIGNEAQNVIMMFIKPVKTYQSLESFLSVHNMSIHISYFVPPTFLFEQQQRKLVKYPKLRPQIKYNPPILTANIGKRRCSHHNDWTHIVIKDLFVHIMEVQHSTSWHERAKDSLKLFANRFHFDIIIGAFKSNVSKNLDQDLYW